MIAALRAWLVDLWHRAMDPVEWTPDEEEWERHYWQAW